MSKQATDTAKEIIEIRSECSKLLDIMIFFNKTNASEIVGYIVLSSARYSQPNTIVECKPSNRQQLNKILYQS